MALSRGKSMLKTSLERIKFPKRISPRAKADHYCSVGLDPEGFVSRFISKEKGLGVYTTKCFVKGEFLLEYVGQLKEGQGLQESQSTKSSIYPRFYNFDFRFNEKNMCIDATNTMGRLGRLVNDAADGTPECNSVMKLHVIARSPRLVLFAKRDISVGEEISYDYGDGEAQWWRQDEENSESGAESPVNPFLEEGEIQEQYGSKTKHAVLSLEDSEVPCKSHQDNSTRKPEVSDVEISQKKKTPIRLEELSFCGFRKRIRCETTAHAEKELSINEEHCSLNGKSDGVECSEKKLVGGEDIQAFPIEDRVESNIESQKSWNEKDDSDDCCLSGSSSNSRKAMAKQRETIAEWRSKESELTEDGTEEKSNDESEDIFRQLNVIDTITVQQSKVGSNKRKNKKHACFFCKKLYQNIARHLQLVHKDEQQVARILALPKSSKQRRQAWDVLVKKGSYQHNYSVLKKGHGLLIPKYRPSSAVMSAKLVPCPSCKGLYSRKELWKHKNRCSGESHV